MPDVVYDGIKPLSISLTDHLEQFDWAANDADKTLSFLSGFVTVNVLW